MSPRTIWLLSLIKYLSTQSRSLIINHVFGSIRQSINDFTQLSGSGLQVALAYGLTQQVDLLRLIVYQNWLSVKCVSSSYHKKAIWDHCQLSLSSSCSKWENFILFQFFAVRFRLVLDGVSPAAGYIPWLVSQSHHSFEICGLVRLKITPPKPLTVFICLNGSNSKAYDFPDPALPHPITISAGDDRKLYWNHFWGIISILWLAQFVICYCPVSGYEYYLQLAPYPYLCLNQSAAS